MNKKLLGQVNFAKCVNPNEKSILRGGNVSKRAKIVEKSR